MGIGTPSQVNNFNKLFKKEQNLKNNQYNGMYNTGNMNMNNINSENNNINNNEMNNQNEKNNMSLDPFKEDINKEGINQNNQSNISKAADINVDQMFEKNKNKFDYNIILIIYQKKV